MEQYPVLPLRNTILFPQQIIPIYIGRKQSLSLIQSISKKEKKYVVVVSQKNGALENPKGSDIYEYGTLAIVMKIFDMPDKSKSAIVQGLQRVRLNSIIQDSPYFKGLVTKVNDSNEEHEKLNSLKKKTKKCI